MCNPCSFLKSKSMKLNNQENLDVDERLDSTGCRRQYDNLQDCIDNYNRDWRRCQSELKDLSKCLDKNKKDVN